MLADLSIEEGGPVSNVGFLLSFLILARAEGNPRAVEECPGGGTEDYSAGSGTEGLSPFLFAALRDPFAEQLAIRCLSHCWSIIPANNFLGSLYVSRST